MADRDCKRVGGIFRFVRFETKQSSHHQLNLAFFGPPVPNHAGFDFHRRVFAQREPGLRRQQQRDTTHMSKFQSTSGVDGVKDFLHCGRIGPMLTDHIAKRSGNGCQTGVQRICRPGSNHSGDYHAMLCPIGVNDAESGPFGSAIDAEYTHEKPKRARR